LIRDSAPAPTQRRLATATIEREKIPSTTGTTTETGTVLYASDQLRLFRASAFDGVSAGPTMDDRIGEALLHACFTSARCFKIKLPLTRCLLVNPVSYLYSDVRPLSKDRSS
jgi:hypothetical protein